MKHSISILTTIILGSFLVAVSCTGYQELVPEAENFVSFVDESVSAPASGGFYNVSVNTSCDWSVSSSEGWIQVTPETGTSATKTLSLEIAENTEVDVLRTGQITLKGPSGISAILTVTQKGAAGPVPPGTEIYTAADFLEYIEVAASFGPSDVSTVYNNIDMGGATLSPVATYAGTLDGQGHKIYNFKVESSGTTAGLFLENTGTIKDLVFGSSDGNNYDGISTIGSGSSSTGLVAVNKGTIENVTTFVTVKYVADASVTEAFGVAGLVGSAVAEGESVSIVRGCTNYASIEAEGQPAAQTGFAGIVGHIGAPGNIVESCTNRADISIGVQISKVVGVSGVIGRSDAAGTYSKLTNFGNISYVQKQTPNNWLGISGIVAVLFNGGVVSEAVNNGNISSDLLRGNRLGGIVAALSGGGSILGSTNNGSVILAQAKNTNWNAVGGIVGSQEESTTNNKDNIIHDCINNGAISLTVNNTTKNVYANTAAGIIGLGTKELSVTGNTNNGKVTATNTAAASVYAGGIYGALMNHPTESEISGNVNTGEVSASGAAACAGGIVGYVAAMTGSDANKVALTLNGEKSTGDITCGNAEKTGAIAGYNGSANLVDCTVGGSVNGTILNESNFESLVQGPASMGTATGTILDGALPPGPAAPGTQIMTADDFKTFLELASGFTKDDVTKVYQDIDLGGAKISPITTYAGTLDGQGHKIYNFKVESTAQTAGLFLNNSGTIKNLVFGSSDGVEYDGTSEISTSSNTGGGNTGLVAVNAGKIENVTTFVTIKHRASSTVTESYGVAGLVGAAIADGENVSTIRDCVNYSLLEISGTPPVQTGFAGIVGYVGASGTIVESCSNEVDITINATIEKAMHVGGIIGRSDASGTYSKLVNNGKIAYVQKETPNALLGISGIVGGMFNGGSITGAVNNGNVSSDLLRGNRLGGILAVMNAGGSVIGSTNNGNITLIQGANTNWNAIGGIVGAQEGSTTNDKDNIIRNCTNNGIVSLTVNNTTKNVYMNTAAGILGLGTQELSITGNTNNGKVTAVNTSTSAVYAGGIYGALMNLPTESEFSGNVNTGAVHGETSNNANVATGGVIGYIAGSTGKDANKIVLSLTGEKSTGEITCGNAEATGAIAGNNGSATLLNCIAGGSVNGTAVTNDNLVDLVQGSASKGTATGTKIAN